MYLAMMRNRLFGIWTDDDWPSGATIDVHQIQSRKGCLGCAWQLREEKRYEGRGHYDTQGALGQPRCIDPGGGAVDAAEWCERPPGHRPARELGRHCDRG